MNLFNKKENKLSKEDAETQLQILLDYYEIDIDDVKVTDAKNGLEQTIDKTVKHIRRGRLEITSGEKTLKVIQTMQQGKGGETSEKIEYGILKGETKMAMRDKKGEDFHGRLYAMMASLGNISENDIKKFEGLDLSVVECLGALYLNV